MSLQQMVHTSGTVVPEVTQNVQALGSGRVAKVAVQVGDSVKKGQLLIQLDPALVNAQVAQAQGGVETAQAARDAARRNLEAARSAAAAAAGIGPGNQVSSGSLQASQSSAGTAVNQAQAALAQADGTLKQANATLQAAQAQRTMLTYNANINGTVLAVNCEQGNPAPLQTPLVVIGDLSHKQVQLQLNELDGGRVAPGQQAQVHSTVLGNQIIKGAVVQVAPAAVTPPGAVGDLTGTAPGNANATVAAKVFLTAVPPVLKSGYTVNVDILTAVKAGVLAIPQEAVFPENNGNYVYRVQSGRIYKVQVQLGIADDVNQEVTAGLKAGDQVVLNPVSGYYDGMPVVSEGSGNG